MERLHVDRFKSLRGEWLDRVNELKLRIQCLLHLSGQERNQQEDQGRDRNPFPDLNETAAPATGDDAKQGERHQQDQPSVARRSRFLVRETEGEQSENGCAHAPKAKDSERKNQKKKKIEQAPGSQPIATHPIRTEQGEQTPPRRNIKGNVQRIGVCLPARGGKFTRVLDASGGLKVEIAGANFDARSSVFGIARDEQSLAIREDRSEILSRSCIQPPDLLHLTRYVVAESDSASVFIQPERAADPQALGLLAPIPRIRSSMRSGEEVCQRYTGRFPPSLGKCRL